MNDDRTIRDRLAELLYAAFARKGLTWGPLSEPGKQKWRRKAALVIKQSPTVKLKIEGSQE